jgi:hypothetical protein
MIAYRAETALVGLLRPHLAKEDEARALIRERFVSAADIEPDEKKDTLTIRIHRDASDGLRSEQRRSDDHPIGRAYSRKNISP